MPKSLYEIVEKYRNETLEYNSKAIQDGEFDVYPILKAKTEEFEIVNGFMIFCNPEMLLEEKNDKKLEKYRVGKDKIPYKHRYYACYNLNNDKQDSLVFIMFNPSTANPEKLDDTIKNCLILAGKKYKRVEILNLCSYRKSSATKECLEGKDTNKKFIIDFIKKNKEAHYVLAWGHGKEKKFKKLFKEVEEITKEIKNVYVIGINAEEINNYIHHLDPRVWNGMGEFEKIAELVEYKKG